MDIKLTYAFNIAANQRFTASRILTLPKSDRDFAIFRHHAMSSAVHTAKGISLA